MKRVAIPIQNGKLSESFGTCNHYEIFEINGDQVQITEIKIPAGKEMSELLSWVSDQGITDVISYKVDAQLLKLFANHKINMYVGIHQRTPKEIIQDYLNGSLKSDAVIISEIMTQTELSN